MTGSRRCRTCARPRLAASIPLLEVNPQTQKTNYLRKFLDKRTFESIVVFVHPDNSFEMLESWRWGFTRSVEMKWKSFKADIDGPNTIIFRKASAPVSVFGRDDDYADTLNSKRIANRITTDAMANFRSSAPDSGSPGGRYLSLFCNIVVQKPQLVIIRADRRKVRGPFRQFAPPFG